GDVTEEDFSLFARHLEKRHMVRLWGWAEAVKDTDREQFEQEQRLRRGPDFAIVEPDEHGAARPARPREVYYPVLLCAPLRAKQRSIGYDLGHEDHRLAAILEALRTGLPTASRPVRHGYLTQGVKGLSIFYPVYERHPGQGLRGFAMAALRLDEIISSFPHVQEQIHLSFWLADDDGQRELIVSGCESAHHHQTDTFLRPMSYFGQVFLLTAHPTDAFLQSYPTRKAWLLTAACLALTVMLAVIVGMVSRRHRELQTAAQDNAQRLSQTEERFNQLLAQTKTVLWECDLNGTITNVRPQHARIYGRAPEDIIGKMRYTDFHPAEGREDYARKTREMFFHRREFFNFLNPVELADGSRAVISTSGMPLRDETGQIRGFYGWNHDVTEHVQLNEQLQKSQAKAEAANRAKGDFLANMSHEVRTPINGIIGFIDLLQDTPLNREQREYLDLVGSSSRQLLMLVNEILDFTRLEAGQTATMQEDFDLEKLLEDAASNIALVAAAKKLEIAVVIPPDLPVALRGDAFHLQQIILNLTSNAIKFTEQGEVAIRVSREHEDDRRVSLRFAVRDTGIGLSKAQLKRIFDVFYQADPSVKRRQGGVGLGLSIVKSLLQRMDSDIQVASAPGQGSEFSFVLNLDKQPVDQARPSLTTSLTPMLVIDDNPTVRGDLLARLNFCQLKAHGAENLAAASQLLAELRAAGTPPRLIILDLDLPELQAPTFDLQWPELTQAGIPFLGLVPMANRNTLPPALTAKVAHMVIKPIHNHDFFGAIKAIEENPMTHGATAPPAEPAPSSTQCGDVSGRPAGRFASPGGEPAQILLAEDNAVNQKVVLAILHKLGHAADVVTNGFEALGRLRRHQYRLVLMDVQMPGMDGLEATRLLRNPNSDVLDHDIPVIALTAHAIDGYQEICRQAGMNDYVTKPITMKQIQQLLNKWLPDAG
ncbi:MAG: CHASE domain-containing protein, partial [Lentisphaeria bacterium]|nr:CHASE domain-containing protein [Lentisphaeria bacterium]